VEQATHNERADGSIPPQVIGAQSRIGQVLEFDDKTAKVQFADEIKVVLKDDLTPIFSTIAP
jgi:hypothetical protein